MKALSNRKTRCLIALQAVLTLAATTAPLMAPSTSQAAVIGGFVGGPVGAAMVVGGIVLAINPLMAATGPLDKKLSGMSNKEGLLWAGVAAFFIVLDDSSGDSSVRFGMLTESKRKALRISRESAQIFNENLEEINAIAQDVSIELNAMSHPTTRDSAELWKRALDANFDSNTQAALKEVISSRVSSKR